MYAIDYDLCKLCHACVKACPTEGAMAVVAGKPKINYPLCSECGLCMDACTHGAIRRPQRVEPDIGSPEDEGEVAPEAPKEAPFRAAVSKGLSSLGRWFGHASAQCSRPGRQFRRGRGRR